MFYDEKKVAGSLLFVGSAQFVLAAIVAEALDTDYTFSDPMNWLGSGSAGIIFNLSLFLLGLFIIVSALLIMRVFRPSKTILENRVFWLLLTVTGAGAAGIGIFNESFGLAHAFAVRVFWIFAVPAAVMSYRFHKKPLSYFSLVLGVFTLVTVVLFLAGGYVSSSFYLGLGRGGMQRLVQYPILLWLLGFGAQLTADEGTRNSSNS